MMHVMMMTGADLVLADAHHTQQLTGSHSSSTIQQIVYIVGSRRAALLWRWCVAFVTALRQQQRQAPCVSGM